LRRHELSIRHPPAFICGDIQFLEIDGLVKSRHSGESRSPGYLEVFESRSERDWIPAFAGMTGNLKFRLFTRLPKLLVYQNKAQWKRNKYGKTRIFEKSTRYSFEAQFLCTLYKRMGWMISQSALGKRF
jgi:hypothetical protein